MENYLSSTLHDLIYNTLPMIVITVIVCILLRVIYLIKNEVHFTLYRELFMLTFIIYILSLFQIVTIQDTVSWSTNNFIPFKEITRYDLWSHGFFKNVIGNICLFLPFGYFISYINKKKKFYEPLFITFVCSLSIELVQMMIGRVFDVDDIILNVIGGMLGYCFYKLFYFIGSKIPKVLKNEYLLDAISIILFSLVIYIIFLI